MINIIFEIDALLLFSIFIYTLIYMKILKSGFITKETIYDSITSQKINNIAYHSIFIAIFFSLLIDLLIYFIFHNFWGIVFIFTYKALFYKIYEYYYSKKSVSFYRKHLEEFSYPKNNHITLIAMLLLSLTSLIIFHKFPTIWIATFLFSSIFYRFYSNKNYRYQIITIKIFELFLIFFLLYIFLNYNTILIFLLIPFFILFI